MEFVVQHSFPIYFILLIWLGQAELGSVTLKPKIRYQRKIAVSICMHEHDSVSSFIQPYFFSSDVKKSPQNVMIF